MDADITPMNAEGAGAVLAGWVDGVRVNVSRRSIGRTHLE
jgi:hypothetical protein